jgi:GTP-binding protein
MTGHFACGLQTGGALDPEHLEHLLGAGCGAYSQRSVLAARELTDDLETQCCGHRGLDRTALLHRPILPQASDDSIGWQDRHEMSGPLQLSFVSSATEARTLPSRGGEVAVVGRSNVGKSSLINALANRKGLAHVSNTPGRTQLINLFELTEGNKVIGAMVDLPGYGFAAAPGRVRAGWPKMIEGYLLNRDELQMVMVLVDGEIGPTKLDVQMLEWLRSHELPHSVVATKHDKVKSSLRERRQRELATGCMLETGDVVWVSAAKGTGIDRLRALVRAWVSPD